MLKRDMLSVLLVAVGILLCGTMPGLALGAPMAALGAYGLAEPRLGDAPDALKGLAGETR
ncbi:hypothetical protein [Haladaptatus sp. R4]|uniref:hypothetical protein n=1 Tax=Haladaptatus sp. R4 TaxID=1679489 RepID=UPI0012375542|nr:hypothetical protein [Haladaptatus sp. R4]